MKDTIVSPDNVHQVVQAMYENIKSNQHRIDAMEPMLQTMSSRVDRLNTLLVENGYAKAVKDSALELRHLRSEFNQYLIDRETSCPVVKRLDREKDDSKYRKDWSATVLRVIFAGIGGLSTLIIIIQTFFSLMGG